MAPPWLSVTRHGYRVHRHAETEKGLQNRRDDRIVVGRGARIRGSILTNGSLLTEASVRIEGDVTTRSRAVIGPRGRVFGSVRSGADVHLLPGVLIAGTVTAQADVHVHQGVSVRGDVDAGGDIVVRCEATTGDVRCGGRLVTHPLDRAPPRF